MVVGRSVVMGGRRREVVTMVTGVVVTVAVGGWRHLLAGKVTHGHFGMVKVVPLRAVAMAIGVVGVSPDGATVVLRRGCDVGPAVEGVVEGFVVRGNPAFRSTDVVRVYVRGAVVVVGVRRRHRMGLVTPVTCLNCLRIKCNVNVGHV